MASVLLYLRARYAGWAGLVSIGSAVVLAGSAAVVEAPITGESVGLPYVWPAVSVMPVVLVARSQLRDWERRGARRLALAQVVVLTAVPGLGAAVVVVLQPQVWRALLAMSLTLQTVAVLGCGVIGEWMWLPVAAIASLTVLRSSVIQDFLVYSASGDHTAVALGGATAAYGLAVAVAARRSGTVMR